MLPDNIIQDIGAITGTITGVGAFALALWQYHLKNIKKIRSNDYVTINFLTLIGV